MKNPREDFLNDTKELNEDIKFFLFLIENCIDSENEKQSVFEFIEKIIIGSINNINNPEMNIEGELHTINYFFTISKNFYRIKDKDSSDYDENLLKNYNYNFNYNFSVFLQEFCYIAGQILTFDEMNNFLSVFKKILKNLDKLNLEKENKEKIRDNIKENLNYIFENSFFAFLND